MYTIFSLQVHKILINADIRYISAFLLLTSIKWFCYRVTLVCAREAVILFDIPLITSSSAQIIKLHVLSLNSWAIQSLSENMSCDAMLPLANDQKVTAFTYVPKWITCERVKLVWTIIVTNMHNCILSVLIHGIWITCICRWHNR